MSFVKPNNLINLIEDKRYKAFGSRGHATRAPERSFNNRFSLYRAIAAKIRDTAFGSRGHATRAPERSFHDRGLRECGMRRSLREAQALTKRLSPDPHLSLSAPLRLRLTDQEREKDTPA